MVNYVSNAYNLLVIVLKHKYKVCVYAICKDEEKNIDRWYKSVAEADVIYVLDTGSSDNSVSKLREYGVNVREEVITPFRFDVARNRALELVPNDADICVCVDLDEVYRPGWRDKMENIWKNNTNRLRHIYNWKLVCDKPVVTFYYEKTHSRYGYKWIHPVHEVLEFLNEDENVVFSDDIILDHYPDINKSRGSYLSLLELSVSEDSLDERNRHYLGREYMYYGMWEKSIKTLIEYLGMERATWKDERASSMRYIARCYDNLGRVDEARIWYSKAIDEAPYLRDGYVEAAMFEYKFNNYFEVINYLIKALMIKEHRKTYVNEEFSWNYTIDNLLGVSYYYLGLYEEALYYIDRAITQDGDNAMLIENKKYVLDKLKKSV